MAAHCYQNATLLIGPPCPRQVTHVRKSPASVTRGVVLCAFSVQKGSEDARVEADVPRCRSTHHSLSVHGGCWGRWWVTPRSSVRPLRAFEAWEHASEKTRRQRGDLSDSVVPRVRVDDQRPCLRNSGTHGRERFRTINETNIARSLAT